jgi:hypothetical protein
MKRFLFFVLFSLSLDAQIGFVQQSAPTDCVYSSGVSFTCSLSATPSQGNTLWLQEAAQNTSANITSVSQDGVTWTLIQAGSTNVDAEIWCGDVSSSAGAVATIGLANGQDGNLGNLAEFSGTAPCSSYDTGASGDNSADNTATSRSLKLIPNTPEGNQFLFLAMVGFNSPVTFRTGHAPANDFIALNAAGNSAGFSYQIVYLSGSSYSTYWQVVSGNLPWETEITGIPASGQ